MRLAIVGFGLMGRQIAQVFIQHGHQVTATDPYPEALKTGMNEIEKGRYGLDGLTMKGKISGDQKKLILSLIRTTPRIEDACKGADLILEAAVEDLKVKQDLFNQLDRISSPDAILASNTSTLSISSISKPARRKERIFGMHFFNPAQITKLVEVIPGREASKEKLKVVIDLVRQIEKTPILAKDEPGFVANRLGLTLFMEASRMLEDQVSTAREIDTAMKLGYGHAMGPFETADIVGLDTRLRNIESLYRATGDTKWMPPKLLRQMVNQGFLGDPTSRKNSRGGYYEYEKVSA